LRVDVLSDAPEDAARIREREFANAPRPILGRTDADTVSVDDSAPSDAMQPIVHALDEQAHLAALGVLGDVRALEEEGERPMPNLGEVIVRPGDLEAEVPVERFVLGGDVLGSVG
jgi:hypothetical protein